MQTYYKKGCWNAICDVCGFEFKSDALRKNWRGLFVCKQDYEPRHPQDSLRVRAERGGVPWSRPEGADIFVPLCTLINKQAITGIGVAGCMVSGFKSNVEF